MKAFFPPASSSCVTTFLLTTILLSLLGHALPATESTLELRQELTHGEEHQHEHGEAHDHGMEGETLVGANDAIAESLSASSAITSTSAVSPTLVPPDPHGHSHGSHVAPKTKLDDQAIHLWHHFPPTYLDADFRLDNDSAIFGEEFDETWDPKNASGHKGLVFLHVLGFYGAYFAILPIALALRAADHPSHYVVNAAFVIVAVLGWLAGAAYNAATPDRYEGSKYPLFVNILLLVSVSLATIDSLGLIKRAIAFYRSGHRSWSDFTSQVLRSNDDRWLHPHNRYEMVGLVEHEEPEEDHQLHRESQESRVSHEQDQHVMFAVGDDEEEIDLVPRRTLQSTAPRRPSLLIRQWSNPSRSSTGSDGTLHDTHHSTPSPHGSYPQKDHSRAGAYDAHGEASPVWEDKEARVGFGRGVEIALTWIRRTQVVFAYVTLLFGVTAYTGMCRAGFINACAAHFIKGSIFFGYGLLTFARYLGAYADLGWAWNRRPGAAKGPSAEMIECTVIFIYGITNTWMERFGAHAGDPYTVKQVQHISIAVMFWFAGLSGILLESRTMRRILSSVVGRRGQVEEPPSYAFSFNPLPALVIAVTGLAMAAHHQDYVFQVEIHSLWGILLAGGSAFRFLTYFFLWLRPPVESTLPSRPPTEVLTSFGYAAGGIVFMLSVEEISFAAMRAGYDDMMAFLNFTIATTSFVFCWTVIVMAVKGWAVLRSQKDVEVGRDGTDVENRS